MCETPNRMDIAEDSELPRGNVSELNDLLSGIKCKWYYRWFPFLPRIWRNRELKLTIILLWDCSYCVRSIGKPNLFDVLTPNHRKFWQPPVCGFQVWI